MPLTRYQIRNEYALADPDLYKAADKDDPEALLEGVAMAGLVGVLRQLGDLAEFAAEVFHDLHEEVISTAARGHSLMIRVQQLEAEVPSIEKAFLSQTNHTSFFTSTGLDWHPNLQSEQSHVARGDLPRFVMDSYEECRGPPRLFLLDKFDVAGAGACLKRYTDPSVFKVERSNIEPQREKKIRKVKKKGPRWRNGGTPEIGPASHTKLHQLFLEERIESCFNDPLRLVKLKKRQFNGCIDSKNGKSYMEKFLETPSPEHKMVYEASVAAPTLHSIADNTNDLGLRILDITTVSPASKSPGRGSTCSSCLAQEEELKRPINGDASGDEIFKMPESTADEEIETTSNLQMVVVENHLEYGEGKTGSSIDGYRSDEVISEVDNYVDALATMESEIETDNEPRSKTVNFGRHRGEPDANGECLETQAQLSDSQSFVNSSGSDNGISSFKRERSSFSCSDTLSSLVDNIQFDSEETAKVLPSIPKACMVDIENMPCNTDYTSLSHENHADEHGVLDDTSVDEERKSKSEVSGDSRFLDSISPQPQLDPESCSSPSLLGDPKLYKKSSTDFANSLQASITETDLGCDEDVYLDVPSKAVSSGNYTIPSEGIKDRKGVDVDATSENSLHLPNVLGQAVEIQAVEKVEDTMLQKEYQDDRTIDKQEIEPSPSSLLPSETSSVSTNDSSDYKYDAIALKGDDKIVIDEAKCENSPLAVDLLQIQDLKDDNIVAGAKYEDLPLAADFSQTQDLKDQVENAADDVLLVEDGRTETDVTYSVRDPNVVDITRADDDGKVTIFTHADDTSEEKQLCYPNDTVPEHLNSRGFVETVNYEGVTLSSTSVSSHDEITPPGDLDHEASVSYSNFATGKVKADEVVDSGSYSDIVTEKVPADKVADSEAFSDIVTEKVQADGAVDSVACSDIWTEKVRSEKLVDFVNCSHVVADKVRADEIVVQRAEVIPKNLSQSGDEENMSIDKLPTGACEEHGLAFDADHTTSNDMNGIVGTPLNDILSTSENVRGDLSENHLALENSSDLSENHSGLENSYPNQNGFKDVSDYSGDKVKHMEVSAPLESKDESISGYQDSVVDVLSFGPKYLELRNLESKPNSYHQDDLKEGIEFISPPPLCFSSAIETSSRPKPDLQTKHKEMELVQEDLDVSTSALIGQRSTSQLDEEKVELVQSSDPFLQDQSFKGKSDGATIEAGHSLSELYKQHPIGEHNVTGPAMNTLQPVLPSYMLLPEVPQVSLNEMPPLPPLPPMQWRLGKIQQAFPAPPRNDDPLKLIFPSSIAPPLQPENPYTCFQDNKLTNISGNMVHNTMQPPPFSLQSPMINNENFQYSSAIMEKQYNNPFLNLPPMAKETPKHDSLKSDEQELHSDPKLPSLGPTNDDANCKNDNESSYLQSFQPFSYSASETVLKPQDFEGGQRTSHAMMVPPSLMKNEQSRDDLPNTEEELASSSNTALMPSTSGVEMPNGNPPTSSKLLRPRSPLIDAVAAHDKSKLRKVSDRILPEMGPKVDERDSLLAQIRTKSFSLKPAVVTRPSIQGPKTNLRVAAILEKANAIRQAFAGSDDEDDNSDSWSDSE
ncbi:protein SCAR2 isoform X2 [Cucumis melo var. makuwa]|uniref:Protein SCAR n=2 Tax=Cucumis melo TaxID=3656 RepID=A0A5A7VCT1_CUCMM|nr:protein SCAR2 isoform X2 [Cucumis melo]KAA0063735.1 protein SCAR2 isoform X2 [Cucumis melo var. makuwa]